MACLDDAVLLDGQASALSLQLGRRDQPLYFRGLGVCLALAISVLPGVHSHIAAGKEIFEPPTSLTSLTPLLIGVNHDLLCLV